MATCAIEHANAHIGHQCYSSFDHTAWNSHQVKVNSGPLRLHLMIPKLQMRVWFPVEVKCQWFFISKSNHRCRTWNVSSCPQSNSNWKGGNAGLKSLRPNTSWVPKRGYCHNMHTTLWTSPGLELNVPSSANMLLENGDHGNFLEGVAWPSRLTFISDSRARPRGLTVTEKWEIQWPTYCMCFG